MAKGEKKKEETEGFTRYEKARIIGARALQIAMGAPLMISRNGETNPIELAKREFELGVLPITVKRPGLESK